MSENKYQLFWIPFKELRNIQKIIGKALLSAKYSAEWTYLYKNRVRTKMVLMKLIHRSRYDRGQLMKELKAFYIIGCKNPTYLQCYGISKDEKSGDYCLIIQYVPLGSLENNIYQISQMKWIEKVNLLFYIAHDLQIIHSLDIIHCNLHDKTILNDDIYNAYTSSFSLSLPAQEDDPGLVGHPLYAAPEVLFGESFSKASDIFSFGVLMWQISSGQSLISEYGKSMNIYSLTIKIHSGMRPTIRKGTISCYSDLMKRCWDSDPTKRPSALKIYKILAYWKNNIAAFYESDPVNYDEGKEISVPKSPVNPTELNESFSDPTEEINEELFEHEIRKKSKFIE
ncbi:kinase-like domain-containing protein [Gigaspora rosea]|uniref:Kinase-like domain-containing protein n=1 Tax=Gigaspora rosea TaxID=44941 RepID=A0A397VEB0_9GLOM|nr:kinase-like domain-containing protein [Gigaspora rosea]